MSTTDEVCVKWHRLIKKVKENNRFVWMIQDFIVPLHHVLQMNITIK